MFLLMSVNIICIAQMGQIFDMITNDKYGNLSHTFLPFCVSAQIVIMQLFQILCDATNELLKFPMTHNVMMDIVEFVDLLGGI